jgi:hypothetical protein
MHDKWLQTCAFVAEHMHCAQNALPMVVSILEKKDVDACDPMLIKLMAFLANKGVMDKMPSVSKHVACLKGKLCEYALACALKVMHPSHKFIVGLATCNDAESLFDFGLAGWHVNQITPRRHRLELRLYVWLATWRSLRR